MKASVKALGTPNDAEPTELHWFMFAEELEKI